MRYIYNDFFTNFASFVRADDDPMVEDIVLNELAYVLAYQRESLVDTMRASGIEVKEDISDKKLIDLISANIGNKKFRKGIGILITKNNKKSLKMLMDKYSNAEGEGEDKGKFKAFWKNLWGGGKDDAAKAGAASGGGGADPITAVANAVGSIFGFLKSGQEKEIINDTNKTELYARYLEFKKNQAKSKASAKKTTLWIVGGIAAATVLTFGFIALKAIRK